MPIDMTTDHNLIEAALDAVGRGPVILALRQSLPPEQSRALLADGRVAGLILPGLSAHGDGEHATHENGSLPIGTSEVASWTIPSVGARTLVYMGALDAVGGRMMLQARRAGIRSLLTLAPSGRTFHRYRLSLLLARQVAGSMSNRACQIASNSIPKFATPAFLRGRRRDFRESFRAFVAEAAPLLLLPSTAFDSRKVIITSGTLGPGGAERQILYTARGLAKAGNFDVHVYCDNLQPPVNDFFKESIEEAGVPVREVSLLHPDFDRPDIAALERKFRNFGPPGFDRMVHRMLAFALLLREQRPSIVHTWMDASNVQLGLAAELVNVPAIACSCRSMAPKHFELHQPYMQPGYDALMKRAGQRVQLLNNSAAGASDYAEWLGIDADRIKVIRNGFEFPELSDIAGKREQMRVKLGVAADQPLVGSILRFSEEKRPGLMIDAMMQMAERRSDLQFVIFGRGVMYQEMCERVKAGGLDDRIRLPGYTDDAWAVLSAMDLFLLTSRMEGLPNVLVEAQAAGVPIVATPVGGVPETIDEGVTGWSTPSDDAGSIAQFCLAILEDRARCLAAGARAAAFTRERFSADQMISQTLDFYHSAVGAGQDCS